MTNCFSLKITAHLFVKIYFDSDYDVLFETIVVDLKSNCHNPHSKVKEVSDQFTSFELSHSNLSTETSMC